MQNINTPLLGNLGVKADTKITAKPPGAQSSTALSPHAPRDNFRDSLRHETHAQERQSSATRKEDKAPKSDSEVVAQPSGQNKEKPQIKDKKNIEHDNAVDQESAVKTSVTAAPDVIDLSEQSEGLASLTLDAEIPDAALVDISAYIPMTPAIASDTTVSIGPAPAIEPVKDAASSTADLSGILAIPVTETLVPAGDPVVQDIDGEQSPLMAAQIPQPATQGALSFLQKYALKSVSLETLQGAADAVTQALVPESDVSIPDVEQPSLNHFASLFGLDKKVDTGVAATPAHENVTAGTPELSIDAALEKPVERPAANTDIHFLGTIQRNNVATTEKLTLPMNVAFGQANWSQELNERTGWLINHKIEQADIQLDPPELGPLAVRIHVQNDQASVSFVAASPVVKDAVEQSMARLKDMLQEQGIALAHSDVSSQQQGQAHDNEQMAAGHEPGISEKEVEQIAITPPSLHQIDYFA